MKLNPKVWIFDTSVKIYNVNNISHGSLGKSELFWCLSWQGLGPSEMNTNPTPQNMFWVVFKTLFVYGSALYRWTNVERICLSTGFGLILSNTLYFKALDSLKPNLQLFFDNSKIKAFGACITLHYLPL